MGIYSKEAKNVYLESDKLYDKKSEDYYKSKMFYGNAQILIDAKSESEAKLFQARAINDFDTFRDCYRVDPGDKLNGIVLKPVGEASNDFIACTTSITGNKAFEHVIVREGKIISANKQTIVVEQDTNTDNNSTTDNNNTEADNTPEVKEQPEENKAEVKEEPAVKEEVNLARDF